MSDFDELLITIIFGLLVVPIGGIFTHQKGDSLKKFILVGSIIVILILGLCGYAYYTSAESDILNIHFKSESNAKFKPSAGSDTQADNNVGISDKTVLPDNVDITEQSSENRTDETTIPQYRIFDIYQGSTHITHDAKNNTISMIYCGAITFPSGNITKTVYLYCTAPDDEEERNAIQFATYTFSIISHGARYQEGNKLYEGGWYLASPSGGGAYLYKVQQIDETEE